MNYHKIDKCSISNGVGFRTVLWVSGCSHHCDGCHNPETWDSESGKPFDDNAKQELFNNLEHSYISGVTFSGGDPLYWSNRTPIEFLAKEIKSKYPNKTIWLYTGYDWHDIKDIFLLRFVDVVVDGIYLKNHKDASLPFRGSSNQRLIDVQKSLASKSVVLYEVG